MPDRINSTVDPGSGKQDANSGVNSSAVTRRAEDVGSAARPPTFESKGIHMGQLSDSELSAKVKQVMIAVLDLQASPDALAEGTSLYSPTLQMDSLTLLHLLVALEKEFAIVIDDEDVMNTNLETVASLIGIVQRAAGAGTQADTRATDAGV